MSTAPTLVVDGLNVRYPAAAGPATVVRDASFTIPRGRSLALVGESGSGKSSLALGLLGLLDPPAEVTARAVALAGQNVRQASERDWSRLRGGDIGLIVQDPMGALDPTRTIGWHLIDTIRRHRPTLAKAAATAEAVALLEAVEIREAQARLHAYPWQFSGGMLQRVVIATAIANNPQLLVADEPTTALDVTMQAQILMLLRRLIAERHLSLLLITHNLALVSGLCDEVLVLYAGRIVERGPVAEVFAQPAHPYTQALLAALPEPERDRGAPLASIPGLPPDPARPEPGCAFAPRCAFATETCRQDPPERDLGEGHKALCHFAGRAGT
jgi:peptide/nickel transport system ATP-binding protein